MKKTLCRLIMLCLLPLAVSACATPQKTDPVSSRALGTPPFPKDAAFAQTLLFGSGVPASVDDFLVRARQADYILIGERHTSSAHHEAQAAIISLLAENGLRPAIGLEMVPAKHQPGLDRFNAREASVDELPDLIDWTNVWGFDFALYRPVFVAAEHYAIPVYGLNVSPEVVQSIRNHGVPGNITRNMTADNRQQLPPVIQYPTTIQREKLSRFFKQHASMLMAKKTARPVTETMPAPERKSATEHNTGDNQTKRPASDHGTKALQRFITVQSLWDSAMGYNATQIAHPGPKIILAGGAHVEYGHGIAYRIRHYVPDAEILLVMPLAFPRHNKTGEADFYFLEKR